MHKLEELVKLACKYNNSTLSDVLGMCLQKVSYEWLYAYYESLKQAETKMLQSVSVYSNKHMNKFWGII